MEDEYDSEIRFGSRPLETPQAADRNFNYGGSA